MMMFMMGGMLLASAVLVAYVFIAPSGFLYFGLALSRWVCDRARRASALCLWRAVDTATSKGDLRVENFGAEIEHLLHFLGSNDLEPASPVRISPTTWSSSSSRSS